MRIQPPPQEHASRSRHHFRMPCSREQWILHTPSNTCFLTHSPLLKWILPLLVGAFANRSLNKGGKERGGSLSHLPPPAPHRNSLISTWAGRRGRKCIIPSRPCHSGTQLSPSTMASQKREKSTGQEMAALYSQRWMMGRYPSVSPVTFHTKNPNAKGHMGDIFLEKSLTCRQKKSVSCHVPTNVIYPFKNGNLRLPGSDLLLAFAPGSLYFK